MPVRLPVLAVLAAARFFAQPAYGLNSAVQIEGPGWLWQETYDMDAPLPEGASKEQAPAMLRALLAERFKLSAHTVTA